MSAPSEEAVSRERIDWLRAALEHLASPNWRAKPTGQDARDMAAFARDTLDFDADRYGEKADD